MGNTLPKQQTMTFQQLSARLNISMLPRLLPADKALPAHKAKGPFRRGSLPLFVIAILRSPRLG